MKGKITVLLPTYNRAEYFLPKAIKSVLDQTYTNFELIIGDNSSTDKTQEVTGAFKDNRIKCRRVEKNTGTPNTFLNWGLAHAEGEWITFIDDDVIYAKDRFETLIAEAKKSRAEVLYNFAQDLHIDKRHRIIKAFSRGERFDKGLYIYGGAHYNFIDISDIFAKTEAVRFVKGFKEDVGYQDYALMVKLSLFYEVHAVEKILTHHYHHLQPSDYSSDKNDMAAMINIF